MKILVPDRSLVLPIFTAIFLGVGGLPAGASSLTALGYLSASDPDSSATGISGDGKVVVGGSFKGNGVEAFRWEGGTMTGLGYLPGKTLPLGTARGVSANGKVVVGHSYSADGDEAFRWENGVMTGLGDLPGEPLLSVANGSSADGNVVVGWGTFDSNYGYEAVRWEGGAITGIGRRFWQSYSTGVSADGKVVVGEGYSASGHEAFRWEGGIVTVLNDAGIKFEGAANGVSADGRVVVGSADTPDGSTEAFRWEGGKITRLGRTGGRSVAYGVSADGKMTVGSVVQGSRAARWVGGAGAETLWDVLLSAGIDPAQAGWTELVRASATSSDGRYVAGFGWRKGHTEAFVADLHFEAAPCPTNTGIITLTVPGNVGGAPKFVMVANPLRGTSTKVRDVIRLGPTDDLILYHYGAGGFTSSVASSGEWIERGDVEIIPGGGFFATSGTARPVLINFSGDPDFSAAMAGVVIPVGLSIRSSPLPKAGPLVDLEYPVSTDLKGSDEIFQLAGQDYLGASASLGAWTAPGPKGPTVRLGEAFWVRREGPAGIWRQSCP